MSLSLLNYLPDKQEIIKIPKQWLVNVAYTIIGNDFDAWISQKIEERNAKLVDSQLVMISVDPEIA